jgi:hypothetical protein
LQEESVTPTQQGFKRFDGKFSARTPSQGPTPLPLPRPPNQSKLPVTSDDKPSTAAPKGHSLGDKMAALVAYRMAQGLCKKCGGKWHKNHKCADSAQLNALQEVWDIVDAELGHGEHSTTTNSDSKQCFLAISEVAVNGGQGPRTLKIRGTIQEVEILVFINSRSSHSFISAQVADQLQGVTSAAYTASVKVANGDILLSSAEMLKAEWFLLGHSFQFDLKVISLRSFDMIVGME